MKGFVSDLGLFAVLTLAFSSLSGCSGTSGNTNIPDPPGKLSAARPNSGSTSSVYPPIPTGLAEAQMEMLDGSKSKVADHKGKVLILNLWAIWCGPCRAEMPHLAEMQKKYPDKLEVISLNIGDYNGTPEPIPNIQKFAEDNKIDYTLGRIPIAEAKPFNQLTKQSGIPQTVMVDAEGHLRGVFYGGGMQVITSMTQALDKLMSEG